MDIAFYGATREVTDDLTYNRQDFWATTSNKQLNFVQHIRTMLKVTCCPGARLPRQTVSQVGKRFV